MDPPVLLAGPTGSGKTALALALAREAPAVIVNADALQVYAGWRVLTARPSPAEEAEVPHRLFGSVGMAEPWSAGHWLRAVTAVLAEARAAGLRPILVGGTGLYFLALTEGLAAIPPVPAAIRAEGDRLRRLHGAEAFRAELAARDPASLAGLDPRNPVRLQRAWEVLAATGRGIAAWQAETPPPLVRDAVRLLLAPATAWLDARLAARFRAMLAEGALEEVRANLGLDPALPSMRAIGARELALHLRGGLPLAEAEARAVTATRRFAKRQRTWFRARMADWTRLDPADPAAALARARQAIARR